jgi:hypothetical protein
VRPFSYLGGPPGHRARRPLQLPRRQRAQSLGRRWRTGASRPEMASGGGGSSTTLFPAAARTGFLAATRVRLAGENALPRYDGLLVEAGGAATEHERGDVVPVRWHGSDVRKRPRGAAASSDADSFGECGGGLEKTSGRAPPASGGGTGGRRKGERREACCKSHHPALFLDHREACPSKWGCEVFLDKQFTILTHFKF